MISILDNKSGYRMYKTPNGTYKYTHRRVGEKKIGRKLKHNEEVHHINKDKKDNRYENLVVLKKTIHKELHKSPYHEKNVCYKCGNKGHQVNNCFAKKDIKGRLLS
jgi:hypothetical protein